MTAAWINPQPPRKPIQGRKHTPLLDADLAEQRREAEERKKPKPLKPVNGARPIYNLAQQLLRYHGHKDELNLALALENEVKKHLERLRGV